MAPRKVLQCHSKGDTDYSALSAKVEVFGKVATIESHYQMSKRFAIGKGVSVPVFDEEGDQMFDDNDEPLFETKYDYAMPNHWREAKGKKPDKVRIGPYLLDPRFLSQWYKLLWLKYLDSHPDLVRYAQGFDDFHDKFRGKSVNCQADVIRQYVKEGRESIVNDCRELLALLRIHKLEVDAKKREFERIEQQRKLTAELIERRRAEQDRNSMKVPTPKELIEDRLSAADFQHLFSSLTVNQENMIEEAKRKMMEAKLKELSDILSGNKCSEISQDEIEVEYDPET